MFYDTPFFSPAHADAADVLPCHICCYSSAAYALMIALTLPVCRYFYAAFIIADITL